MSSKQDSLDFDKRKEYEHERDFFRGKRKDNGEWVYGYYAYVPCGRFKREEHLIQTIKKDGTIGLLHEVIPDTVGQDTKLTDKKDVKIFEGDIVKFKHGGEFAEGGIYFRNYAVEFVNTFVTYGLRLRNRSIHFPFKQATAAMHDVEVVGNIHDNPELLEVKNA